MGGMIMISTIMTIRSIATIGTIDSQRIKAWAVSAVIGALAISAVAEAVLSVSFGTRF